MSELYYYNKSTDEHGNHEVHTGNCTYCPNEYNRVYIGLYTSCSEAIAAAKQQTGKSNFDGCYWCCRPCHKG